MGDHKVILEVITGKSVLGAEVGGLVGVIIEDINVWGNRVTKWFMYYGCIWHVKYGIYVW